jgi:DNA-binding response OmpR family regulator
LGSHPALEDESDLAVTYDRLPRRESYRVLTAASRLDGFKAIESAPPALVIADLGPPVGDGLDTVRAAHARNPKLPVMLVHDELDHSTS